MCGIYGVVSWERGRPSDTGALDAMAGALRHRGPDGHARWCDTAAAIGATRLRVIDLDPHADQPLVAPGDAAVLVVNGEIYNAGTLRARYRRWPFHTRSDVECVLPLLLERGAAGCADLQGMFALALWQPGARRLILARDRAGEKPLFYARVGGSLVFASELGALLADARIARRLDPVAVADYARHGFAVEPRTLLAAVRRVPAGTALVCTATGNEAVRYWNPDAVAVEPGRPDPNRIEAHLERAVREQTRADVPIGVFTSGGLDSSLVAVLAARAVGPERLHTFAVGFPDRRYDERLYARRLARHIGSRHTEVVASEAGMREALDDLLAVGEPLADPAALPTWLLARAAREHVTVVLAGEGGDELFGGYPTYVGHRFAGGYTALPAPVRRLVRSTLARVPASTGRIPVRSLLRRFADEAARPWPDRHAAWFGSGLPADALARGWGPAEPVPTPWAGDVVGSAMRLDYALALRERLLVKLDRATMRASLESRAPYLDADVTRAALAIAGTEHVRAWRTKRVLRRVARRWLPPFILRRRKRGLSVPIAGWLNGALAPALDDALDRDRVRRAGVFDAEVVARCLREHRAGHTDHARGLWSAFVFHRWMERWGAEP